ncbi:MAG TPA: hypothetical protein DCW46_05155 [Desulfotomaculum sp.]|nr:hypothetical protein [Desulfotomaculum sp.]
MKRKDSVIFFGLAEASSFFYLPYHYRLKKSFDNKVFFPPWNYTSYCLSGIMQAKKLLKVKIMLFFEYLSNTAKGNVLISIELI